MTTTTMNQREWSKNLTKIRQPIQIVWSRCALTLNAITSFVVKWTVPLFDAYFSICDFFGLFYLRMAQNETLLAAAAWRFVYISASKMIEEIVCELANDSSQSIVCWIAERNNTTCHRIQSIHLLTSFKLCREFSIFFLFSFSFYRMFSSINIQSWNFFRTQKELFLCSSRSKQKIACKTRNEYNNNNDKNRKKAHEIKWNVTK